MMRTGILGFTGTRNDLTKEQISVLKKEIRKHKPLVVVHGDCIGADEMFHQLCCELGEDKPFINIRPCRSHAGMRAYCQGNHVSEEKAPMQRNRDIASQAHHLIACPPNKVPIKSGSGTWATIGFAKKAGIGVTIIFPDGTIDRIKQLKDDGSRDAW